MAERLGGVGKRFGVRRGLLAAVPLMVGLAGLAPVASAQADTLTTTVQSAAPEQGVPLTLEFAGQAAAIDNDGDGPYLYAVVRPAGGIPCQSSYGSDEAAAGGASTTLTGDFWGNGTEVDPGSVSDPITYNPPNVGSYTVCAWLENNGNDDSDSPLPAKDVTAGPVTTGFTTRPPQVSDLKISLGSPALPGVGYQIDYTTQTDQQLSLESMVKPAGGLPCASSYELEGQQNQTESDVFDGGTSVFGGPTATTATDTETTAGPYLVCAWIEGPNTGEVDAATSLPIYVGTPPPAPASTTPKPAGAKQVQSAGSPVLRITQARASRRHGALVRGTTAPGLSGRVVVSATCGRATSSNKPRVGGGHFSTHLNLPYACRRNTDVRIKVSWGGSATFARGSTRETLTVKR